MPSLNQRGAIQFVVLLILLAGLAVGVYLVTSGPLKLFPKAFLPSPIIETSFSLEEISKGPYPIGSNLSVAIHARSDLAEANLYAAKISFPTDLLEAVAVGHKDYNVLFSDYAEQSIDNNTGKISVVATKPNPGSKTEAGTNYDEMAIITFKVKAAGNATISIADDAAIYRNSDNTNILATKRPITVTLASQEVSPPAPERFVKVTFPNGGEKFIVGETVRIVWSSSPNIDKVALGYSFGEGSLNNITSAPITNTGFYDWNVNVGNIIDPRQVKIDVQGYQTGEGSVQDQSDSFFTVSIGALTPPTVTIGNGDGNKDGKFDLVDLSILLSDFNKTGGFRVGIDLNGDGKINTFDFALMRNLLIEKGIIKGTNSPLP